MNNNNENLDLDDSEEINIFLEEEVEKEDTELNEEFNRLIKEHDDLVKERAELSQQNIEAIKRVYPEDSGLFYVQNYMIIFEPATKVSNRIALKDIVMFYMARRDAPNFVRELVGQYLSDVGYKREHIINWEPSEESEALHRNNADRVYDFITIFQHECDLAARLICIQYDEEEKGNSVERLTFSGEAIEDATKKVFHAWFDSSSMRNHLRKLEGQNRGYIAKLVNSDSMKPRITIEDESVFDKLEQKFPNFKEVVRYYKAQFRLLEETNKIRINPILLVGPPGIGKSQFTKALTEAINTTMTYLDLSCVSTGWLLSGMSVIWSTPKVGKIVETLKESKTVNPIIVLDEIEKPTNPEHDPKASLYQLLEEGTAKVFVDEFIEHPIDSSGIIYIACANELKGIAEPLLTRFKVFNIQSPSREEKISIFQNIYKEATTGTALFKTTLNEALVDNLIDKSLREVKQFIIDAVGNALLEYTKAELQAMKQHGEQIEVQARHLNLPQPEKKKTYGF
jgi:SpoVK/Ycf46/Vps4 family AAA+-type ATPase